MNVKFILVNQILDEENINDDATVLNSKSGISHLKYTICVHILINIVLFFR